MKLSLKMSDIIFGNRFRVDFILRRKKMSVPYNHKEVESKWQKVWDDEKAFKVGEDYSKPKYYALVEFPYPSGQGLHVGHPRPYTALDIVARKRRLHLSAYSVIFNIHWLFTLRTTSEPHLSQTPFTTSSLASPTLQEVYRFGYRSQKEKAAGL